MSTEAAEKSRDDEMGECCRYAIWEPGDVIHGVYPTFSRAATAAAAFVEATPWSWHDARPLLVGKCIEEKSGRKLEPMCRVTRRAMAPWRERTALLSPAA